MPDRPLNRTVDIDRFTNSQVAIDLEHRKVHKGLFYSFNHAFSAVPVGQTRHIAVQTSLDCGALHLRETSFWTNKDEVTYRLYENPLSVVGGTPIIYRNRNRMKSDVDGCIVAHTTTLDLTGATLLEAIKFGGGGGSGAFLPWLRTVVGGSRSVVREWVFPPDEYFVLTFENNSIDAADIDVSVFFYKQPIE